MSNDLDTLFPGQDVTVAGQTITVKPLTFGQLPKATKLLQPVIKALRASGAIGANPTSDTEKPEGAPGKGDRLAIDFISSWVDTVAAGGEDLLALVGYAIDKPRDWFDALSMDDGVALVRAVVEVNGDFFGRRVLPMLIAQEDGEKSSPSSSQPGTDAPTSTATP